MSLYGWHKDYVQSTINMYATQQYRILIMSHLLSLHVQQVPMLLFVLYNTLKALVGKTHSINELHSYQNHRQITLLFYIINFSMQDGVGKNSRTNPIQV